MRDASETLCFTCGLPTGLDQGEFPRLNTLPSGQPCRTCRDRLLECLAPILPGEVELEEEFGPSPGENGYGEDSYSYGEEASHGSDEPFEGAEEVPVERSSPASDALPRSFHWGARDTGGDEPA